MMLSAVPRYQPFLHAIPITAQPSVFCGESPISSNSFERKESKEKRGFIVGDHERPERVLMLSVVSLSEWRYSRAGSVNRALKTIKTVEEKPLGLTPNKLTTKAFSLSTQHRYFAQVVSKA